MTVSTRRLRYLAAALGLLVVTALAGCGEGVETTDRSTSPLTAADDSEPDDDGQTATTTTEAEETTTTTADDSSIGEPSDDAGGEAASVDEYCDTIEEFRALEEEVLDNPTAENSQRLSDLGEELAALSAELPLGDLSVEDLSRITECSSVLSEPPPG